jgi:hypothetical protein
MAGGMPAGATACGEQHSVTQPVAADGAHAIHPVAGSRLAGNGAFDSSIASWLMWCVTTAATVRFLEGIL